MRYSYSHPFLFRQPARGRRIGLPVFALGCLMAINVNVMVPRAFAQDVEFDKLVERSGPVGNSLIQNGTGLFGVAGGNEEFEFTRNGRTATIKFLCDAGATGCTDVMRKSQPLEAEPGGRGDMVFKSNDGIAVLRITATGGATLFGGASFVPASIPKSGRAVVPL